VDAAFAVLTITVPSELGSKVGIAGAALWDAVLQAMTKTRKIAQQNRRNLFDNLSC
jgi:hypothetical protein